MTAINDPRELIDAPLIEVDEEAGRLNRALESLFPSGDEGRRARARSTSPKATVRPPRRRARSRRTRTRAKRDQRQAELLALISRMRGASPNELAYAMKIGSSQIHRLLRKAEVGGLIVKNGQGFDVVNN